MDPKHNLDALLIGTAEFGFSEGASNVAESLVKGFLDIGNLQAFTPETSLEHQEHNGHYRGVRRNDKTVVTEDSIEYVLRADEWNKKLVEFLFGGEATADLVQGLYSSGLVMPWPFTPTTPSDSSKWYDVKHPSPPNVRVTNITALTISALTEGTDFEVDYLVGRVRFLTPQTSTLTPVVTAPTSTAQQVMSGIIPMRNVNRVGYGRLLVYDQNDKSKIVLDHRDFSCEVVVESAGEINGQNFSELTIRVTVTEAPGVLYERKANA